MPYITIPRRHARRVLTLEAIWNGFEDLSVQKDTNDTMTFLVDEINQKLCAKTNFVAMLDALRNFTRRYQHLINVEDKSKLYYSFKIPKRSGGLRQIDAPNEELKQALYDLKYILENKFFMSYHTSAFAYIRGRSTIDSIKRHQQNHSRWFLKMDMKNFFPSTTMEFLTNSLYKMFPFCELVKYSDFDNLFKKALSLCFLNGGLPQGTPTSPMLTNAMMISIDHAIAKMCRENHPHLCYTRYADDLLISSEYDFRWSEVQEKIVSILQTFNAPFTLNHQKTRYGSSSGSNWNLGVMLNANNEITIGHEKKKIYKAMVFQFMADYAKGNVWELEDAQHLMGLTSYYRMVEPKKIDEILANSSKKFNKDVLTTIKSVITT